MTHSTLQFTLVVSERGTASIRPVVDGQDLLDGHKNNRGLDPDRLLPPLTDTLYPISAGRSAVVGSCDCGETGCGSLNLRVRRQGDEVLWEPSSVGHETIGQTYRFELMPYLDALEGVVLAGEGRGRQIARRVRLALAGGDQRYDTLTMFHVAGLDWIGAWPWSSDTVKASISTDGNQTVHEYTPGKDESDDDFGRRILLAIDKLRLGQR